MNRIIHYAGLCLQGLVRKNNEDNYRIPEGCLPMIHGDKEPFSGSVRPGPWAAFGVFDGMGGEMCGEAASYTAAAAFDGWSVRRSGSFHAEEAEGLCRALNREVLSYAARHRAPGMGSTAAALCFDADGIRGFNIGDSRCLMFSEGALSVLSTDHVVLSPITRRARLTQCLGIPEEEFLLEPAFFSAPYREGDLYLLCSDGLTGVVSHQVIEEVLSEESSLSDKLARLREEVFRRGAPDNLTILLLAVTEECHE
ncbi:MAG: serine/threonine-protein phosphatase [Lachnospiraceae bacterium]|nr:serine/threonine-protein phosphatase [Lachnospiraceae bacterium]